MKQICLILVAAIAVGCSSSSSGGSESSTKGPAGPAYRDIVLTDDETSKAPKATFAPDTPKIWVFFGLDGFPAGSKIKGVWICEKSEGIEPNYKIDEAGLNVGPPLNSGNFSISKPKAGWPVGDYRVDLYIGEQIKESVKFTIAK